MKRSGTGTTPEALPIPSSQLDRYRLRLRQRDRGTVAGAHLIRQRGQSLEFREFRPYLPGDDIRHVDWRASARHQRRNELVVRTFEHEVQTRVVISIDTRATMRLPDVAPKLQLARWFAEAMAYIAGRYADSVALLLVGRRIERTLRKTINAPAPATTANPRPIAAHSRSCRTSERMASMMYVTGL